MDPEKQVQINDSHIEEANDVSFDIETDDKKVLQLSKNQLKKLGLVYKKEPTEKEKERNERLSKMQKERHAQLRKDKEEYEKKQLEELAKKVAIQNKPKQKYVKKPPVNDSSSDSDDADYREFMKFKIAKSKAIKEKPKDPESDDERVQKKKAKAKEIIDTVQKIDKTINKIYKNPYLDLFNKK
jgi:hypothetical protein